MRRARPLLQPSFMGIFDSPIVDLATSPTVDAFGIVGKGIGAGTELREGHTAEGVRKTADTLGAEFKLVNRIFGDDETKQISGMFGSVTSFADATEHLSKPKRLAWRSMCATDEGKQKGERWCKLAIWGNTLPALKKSWKNVNKVTSAAFVEMWQQRVSQFYARYSEAAAN